MAEVRPIPDDPDADDRLRDLLRAVIRDAAPVDHAALESIRGKLSPLSSASTPSASPLPPGEGPGVRAPHIAPAPVASASPRKPSMFTKLAAVSVAAVSCAALWIASLFGPGGGDGIALGEVLRPLNDADQLHLQVVRGDDTSEIWIQQ